MEQLIYFVVMLVLSYALQPKPPQPKAAAFDDFDFPTAEDGTPQIVVFGDVWLTDWTVIGVGNYRNEVIMKSSGGLFSKSAPTGHKYFMSILMGVCRGIDDLVEIKIGDKTAWMGNIGSDNKITIAINKPNLFGGDDAEGGIDGKLIIMKGAADQDVLTELELMWGTVIEEGYYIDDGGYYNSNVWVPPVIEPALVPAFRGVVTFFYDGVICSNSPYPKPWSFRVRRSTSGWDGAVWYPAKAVISMNDDKIKAMNPAHIIFEAQTNRVWGRGFSSSQLDLASFQIAADKLYNEGFGICLAWRRQDSLSEFIQQIVDTIGAALFLDRLTGLWKLVLIREDYDVATLPIYNSTNGLLNITEDNNAANDVAANQTNVTYRDPITNEDQPVRAENIASIQKYGVISENKTYAGIPTQNLAGRVAARDMKIAQAGLKKFKLEFDRRAFQMQPMSVFKINAQEQGIDSIALRAVRVEHNDITEGKITVTCVQDVFGLSEANFMGNQPSLHQPPITTAQQVTDPVIYEVPFFELLQDFSATDLVDKSGQGYFAVAAAQPSPLHMSFDLLAKGSTEVSYIKSGSSDFAFITSIASAVIQTATTVTCTLKNPIRNIVVGDRALLGSEIVRIDAINLSTNAVTIARGCIDTVPQAHAVGTKFAVYSNLTNAVNRLFNNDQTANLKFITRTASDVLNEASATVFSASLSNRLARPYPPAKVKLNSAYFPNETDVSDGLAISWEHRNRLTQNGQAPSFIESSSTVEAGTTYNLKIFDANNIELLNKVAVESPYTWNVPRRFDGEMTTVLDIAMTGTNNSRTFVDNSPNSFPISNDFNAIIKTDADAIGGSSARFEGALLTSSIASKLHLYDEDHCIEFRIKTLTELKSPQHPDGIVFGFSSIDNGSIPQLYSISAEPDRNSIIIKITGRVHANSTDWIGTAKEIVYTATGLTANSYCDVAVQYVKNGTITVEGSVRTIANFTIFINGVAVITDFLHIFYSGTTGGFDLTHWTYQYSAPTKTILNGFRVTKSADARYSADYAPQPFVVGSSDPYWNDVVLLLTMNGANNSQSFVDVSNSPVTLQTTDSVNIRTDASAHGGSAAHFCYAMLTVGPDAALNLKDKSFIITGRVKGYGTILEIPNSMRLSVNQYALALSNEYESTPVDERQTIGCWHNYIGGSGMNVTDTYFTFKIMRDGGTGITSLWFNDMTDDGLFNPADTGNSSVSIGAFDRAPSVYATTNAFNGLNIQTAEVGAGLILDVANPVRIELESQRDGLKSNQAFSAQVTVV